MPVPEGMTREIFTVEGVGSLGFLRVSTRSMRSYKSRAASPFFWLAMMRLKSSGFAGPIVGVVSGTADCAAASAAKASDSSAMGTKVYLCMMQSGQKSVKANPDWIRLVTQLLYTAIA